MLYADELHKESSIAVSTYREFIRALAIDGEQYPIPEFTLACMRKEAEDAIRRFRLAQIAVIASAYDYETKLALTAMTQNIERAEDETMAILTGIHLRCLEERDSDADPEETKSKLLVRWE